MENSKRLNMNKEKEKKKKKTYITNNKMLLLSLIRNDEDKESKDNKKDGN